MSEQHEHEALEARIIAGTTTKADIEWLVESLEVLAAERDELRVENKELRLLLDEAREPADA